MNKQSDIYHRQNDKTAITLYKASYRCLRNERIAKYIMIVLSFGICLAAIFNKYLPQVAPDIEDISHVQEVAATYINLVSGVILVLNIVVGFYTSRMHTEGTVLRDRYDSYVFDNPPNLSILRPISQTVIKVYAQKTRKRDDCFKDIIFDPNDDPDPDIAQFNYINKEAHSDYRLYISIQPFFMTLWIGFCILIIILAVAFDRYDQSFVKTLINIMIPSLSAISTICNSWYNCRLQMKQLQNLLTVIDQIQSLPDNKRLVYIKDKRNMRALADGLYNYRVSAFVIPNFLVRRHLRRYSEDTVTFQLPGEKRQHKTEMPTLALPDITDAVPEINEVINSGTEIRTVTFSPTHTVDDVNTQINTGRYTGKTKRTSRTAKPEQKPAAKPEQKPAAKPEQKPAAKPEQKPATKPEQKPAAKPEQKPAAKPETKRTIKK